MRSFTIKHVARSFMPHRGGDGYYNPTILENAFARRAIRRFGPPQPTASLALKPIRIVRTMARIPIMHQMSMFRWLWFIGLITFLGCTKGTAFEGGTKLVANADDAQKATADSLVNIGTRKKGVDWPTFLGPTG